LGSESEFPKQLPTRDEVVRQLTGG